MLTAVHTTYRHIDNQNQYCIYLVYAEIYCRILTDGRPDFREFLFRDQLCQSLDIVLYYRK